MKNATYFGTLFSILYSEHSSFLTSFVFFRSPLDLHQKTIDCPHGIGRPARRGPEHFAREFRVGNSTPALLPVSAPPCFPQSRNSPPARGYSPEVAARPAHPFRPRGEQPPFDSTRNRLHCQEDNVAQRKTILEKSGLRTACPKARAVVGPVSPRTAIRSGKHVEQGAAPPQGDRSADLEVGTR